jgi:hypothetical protein
MGDSPLSNQMLSALSASWSVEHEEKESLRRYHKAVIYPDSALWHLS